MWTVGLLLSGNAAGLTELEFLALDEESRQTLRDRAAVTFAHAQPHYLIDTVAQLPAVIEQITERMAQGECPADSL
jgi:phosphonoacetaldehyde hydrolase